MRVKSLEEWFEKATPEQRAALNATFDRVVLSQLRAKKGKPHHREASARRAGEIESAVVEMSKTDSTVPLLSRGDLCDSCNSCEYWRKAQCL